VGSCGVFGVALFGGVQSFTPL